MPETTGAPGPAAERWRRLVTGRLEEMETLWPDAGLRSGAFWDRRVNRSAPTLDLTEVERQPFLRRLRRAVDPSSKVIDVGAGRGRFALALAPQVRRMTAVDPSKAALALLRRDARRLGLKNVRTVTGRWEEADTAVADVAFSSLVLTLVPDAPSFLLKLQAVARRHVFLHLGAYTGDAVLDPLWRHFHGAPRAPGPSYLDAIAVLDELGISHTVRVVELPNRTRFATVDEAVAHYRDALLLADTPDVRRELAGLLASWLMGRKGALRSPLRTVPAAIIHWRPEERSHV